MVLNKLSTSKFLDEKSVMKDPDFYLLNDVTFQFFSRKISANFIDFHSEEEAL